MRHGRASRALAQLGAHVTGVDLSAELVARARAQEEADPLGIRYYAADVADLDRWWDGTAFDGAVSEMAMMDIDDLHGQSRRDNGVPGRLVRDLDGPSLFPRQ